MLSIFLLAPADGILEQFTARRELPLGASEATIEAGSMYNCLDAFTCHERFAITGKFTCSGSGSFGLAFDYNGREDKYKMISLSPRDGKLQLFFNEGSTLIAENAIDIQPGQEYSFTYIQEGSVGAFYLDGQAALTVRLYGVSGKPIKLFAESNALTFSSLRQYTC